MEGKDKERNEKPDKQSDKKLNYTQSQQPREEEQKRGSNPSYPTIL